MIKFQHKCSSLPLSFDEKGAKKTNFPENYILFFTLISFSLPFSLPFSRHFAFSFCFIVLVPELEGVWIICRDTEMNDCWHLISGQMVQKKLYGASKN